MIENLKEALKDTRHPGLDELRHLLETLLGGRRKAVRFVEEQCFQSHHARVYRLRFTSDGDPVSVVVKVLEPAIAHRNELVIRRWLPAVGMAGSGPVLLGSAAERTGVCIWHVYEDFGDQVLGTRSPDRVKVKVAVEAIAQIHSRFVGHTLLPEVRLFGGDLGASFFTSSVHDAIRSLELLRARITRRSPRYVGLCDRLLEHLYKLRDEHSWRVQVVAELGGPETLLHGDLWTTNTFVLPAKEGFTARLIDWDHAAVGPVSYDLSTFLLRFPRHARMWIFDLYGAAMKQAGWRTPSWREFNLLSETAEYARISNRIIWPAIALMKDKGEWAFEMLEEIEHWFDDLRPVLPQRYDFEKILASEST